jgi:protein disulfide-isomerase
MKMENKLKYTNLVGYNVSYCYIGKRRIEGALESSMQNVEIEWKLPTRCSFIASEDDNMVSIWPKRKDKHGHKK